MTSENRVTVWRRFVRLCLPLIATVITALPCWSWLCRLLDRLVVVAEGQTNE